MSRGLNEFVRNFLAGAQLGSHFVDQHEQRQHRKQMLEATIARNAQAAAAAKERMANERERTRLYGIGVEAKAARDRAKAAGGGAAGPPAGLDEWAAKHVPDYAGPPTPTPITMTVNTESNDSVAAPPSYGSDGAGDGDGAIVQARGGIARKIVQGFGAGAAAGRRALDTRYPGTPPFNPNAQTGGAGTTGPGSGMGQQAAPPDLTGTGETYSRGGRAKRYAGGGEVSRSNVPGSNGMTYDLTEDAMYPPGSTIIGPDGKAIVVTPDMLKGDWLGRDVLQRKGVPTEHRPQTAKIGSVPNAKVGTRHSPRDTTSTQFGPGGGADVDPNAPRDWQPGGEMPNPPPPEDTPFPLAGPPTMPPTTVTGQRPPGGPEQWKRLRDQTRTKAFDPAEKDLYDPDNVHAVDGSGRDIRGAINTAPPAAQGPKGPRTNYGPQGGTGLDPKGSDAGMSTNSARNDYTDAMAGATSYADRVSQGMDPNQAKSALYSGQGAASPKVMQQVFQTIDPDNTMSMDQKIQRSVKAVHDYYMAKGDKETADRSAFEVAQFSNQMASNHGRDALKLLQKGDTQGAVGHLIAGYNWLPDGYTASVQGQNIVLSDESGKVVQSYALDPRGMQNIALGMATGQLGWDVIRTRGMMGQLPTHIGGGQQPPGGPPGAAAPPAAAPTQQAAQPPAVPAGPAAQPPTAIQTSTPPTQVAQAPPTTAPPTLGKPAPTTLPQTAPAPTTPRPAPTTQPAPAPQTTPAPAPTTTPPTAVKVEPPKPKVETKTEVDPKKAAEDYEKMVVDHFAKNPYEPLPNDIYRHVAQNPNEQTHIVEAMVKRQQQHIAERNEMMEDARKKGLLVGKGGTFVRGAVAHKDKQYEAWMKEANAKLTEARRYQQTQDQSERNKFLNPRKVPEGGEGAQSEAFEKRRQEIMSRWAKEPRSRTEGREAQDWQDRQYAANTSPLRYMKEGRDLEMLESVARRIWQYNDGMNEKEAYDAAVAATSIVLPRDGKPKLGSNTREGQHATVFRPKANLSRTGYVLMMPDGRAINVDNNGYSLIRSINTNNWNDYTANKEKVDKQIELSKKAKEGLPTLLPKIIPPIGTGLVR